MEPEIKNAGHQIKFAVTRGPFNIASFLIGTNEFFLAMMTDPDNSHKLLRTMIDFKFKDEHYER